MSKVNLRPLLLALCLVLLPVGLSAQKIKFTAKSLPRGCVVTLAESSVQNMTNNTSMGGQVQSSTSLTERRVIAVFTVLESSTKGVVKARVHYKKHENKTKMTGPMGNQEVADPSPLEGNTYVLSIKDGQLIARNEKGEEPSQQELKKLKEEFTSEVKAGALADPHMKMREQPAVREMSVGESITLDKETAAAMFGDESGDEAPPIREMVLKLTGTRNVLGAKCAVFDVKIDMDTEAMAKQIPMPDTKVTVDMTGEIIMGIEDCWGRSFKMGGPMTFKATQSTPNGDVSLDVNMKMDMTGLATFALPAK